MRSIWREYLYSMLRRWVVVLYVGLTAAGAIAVAWWGRTILPPVYPDLALVGAFYEALWRALVFFWSSGLPLLFCLAGAGIWALGRERQSGLLALTLSRAVSRRRLLGGQYLALISAALLLSVSGLLLTLVILAYGAELDGEVVAALAHGIPAAVLYSLVWSVLASCLILAAVHAWRRLSQRLILVLLGVALWLGLPLARLWQLRAEGLFALLGVTPIPTPWASWVSWLTPGAGGEPRLLCAVLLLLVLGSGLAFWRARKCFVRQDFW